MNSNHTEILRRHLLQNFCDGDSWKDADALSLTKHGALDVAKYFYELGCDSRDKEILGMIEGMKVDIPNKPHAGKSYCPQCEDAGYNTALDDVAAALKQH